MEGAPTERNDRLSYIHSRLPLLKRELYELEWHESRLERGGINLPKDLRKENLEKIRQDIDNLKTVISELEDELSRLLQ